MATEDSSAHEYADNPRKSGTRPPHGRSILTRVQAAAEEGEASRRPLRVYVAGYYGWRNKGDAALLLTFDAELLRRLPTADVRYTSKTPADDQRRLGAHFIGQRLTGRSVLGRLLLSHFLRKRLGTAGATVAATAVTSQMSVLVTLGRLARRLGGPRGRLGRILLPGTVGELAAEIAWADVVVGAPGGYLLAPGAADVGWQYSAAPLLLAAALGKPVVLAHCSLGPFAGVQRRTARAVVRDSSLIVTRERFSSELALELGAGVRRVVTATDLAWLFDGAQADLRERWPDADLEQLPPDDRPLIGISVRSHDFAGHEHPRLAAQRYREAIAQTADHMVRRRRARIVFVPHYVAGRASDIDVSQAIHRSMVEADSARVLEADLSPAGLQDLYAACEVVVATRAHAAILALSAGTPVAAISYGRKTDGLMADLGLERYLLSIDSVTTDALIERVSEILDEPGPVKRLIAEALPGVRLRASRGMDELARVVVDAGADLARRKE